MTAFRAPAPSAASDDSKVGVDVTQRFLREHPKLVSLGRVGWVAKGVVYVIVGVLAFSLAAEGSQQSGSNGAEASQSGAVARIADARSGAAVLIVVAIGLVIYAAWRLVTAALPAENTAKAWLTRAGYVVSAVLYGALALTAWSFARAGSTEPSSGESEDAKVERFTSDVLETTGGRWLLGLIAIVIVAVGAYFVAKGARRHFDDQLAPGSVGALAHRHVVVLGRIGWIARGVIVILVGALIGRAAWQADPTEAQGFDGTLRETLDATAGPFVVAAIGIGLTIYGVYCVISAPLRRPAPVDH